MVVSSPSMIHVASNPFRLTLLRAIATLSLWLVFAGGAAVLSPGRALCETRKDAEVERLNREMVVLFRQKRYLDAVRVARKLYARTRQVQLLANIGRCFDLMGRDLDALRNYQRFLAATNDVQSREHVLQRVLLVRQRLSLKMREVNLVSRPSGANIFVDGRALSGSKTPATLWLRFGRHRVELRLAGYVTVTRELELDSGAPLTLDLALVEQPRFGRVTIRGPQGVRVFFGVRSLGPLPLVGVSLPRGSQRLKLVFPDNRERELRVDVREGELVVVEVPRDRRRVTPDRSGRLRIAGYVLLGVGAALLGGGLGFQLWAKRTNEDADKFFDRHVGAGTFDQAALDDYNRQYDSVVRRQKAAIALFTIGAASVISGIVLVVVGHSGGTSEREASRRLEWRPTLYPNGFGLSASMRF